MKHWSADTLPPALIVGWFSWWIWCRFLVDVYFGAWGYFPASPLWYFNTEISKTFYSLPDMMLWITGIAVALAIPVLIFRRSWTWQGRSMTFLAHSVLIASVGYTVAVHCQEEASANLTWQYIRHLELIGEERDELDMHYYELCKDIYARYEANNKR